MEFEDPKKPGSRMLLTPEKSIESQNDIGADIMRSTEFQIGCYAELDVMIRSDCGLCAQERMALDDVAALLASAEQTRVGSSCRLGLLNTGRGERRGSHPGSNRPDPEMAPRP